jgi:hypothetical protein
VRCGVVLVLGLTGCDQLFGLPQIDLVPAMVDSAPQPDTPLASDWAPPQLVNIGWGPNDDDPTLTGDLLELYYNLGPEIYVIRRDTIGAQWSSPDLIDELSSPGNETTPEVAANGLVMYFCSTRNGTTTYDVFRSARSSRTAAWSTPVELTELSSTLTETAPAVSGDELAMVFTSFRDGDASLYRTRRADVAAPWDAPIMIGFSQPTRTEDGPWLSYDGLRLYFNMPNGTLRGLYLAERASTDADFGSPQLITALEAPEADDDDMWLSPDERHVFFISKRTGVRQLWYSSR